MKFLVTIMWFVVVLLIYMKLPVTKNWLKTLNEYDDFKQDYKMNAGTRWIGYFAYGLSFFFVFIVGFIFIANFLGMRNW